MTKVASRRARRLAGALACAFATGAVTAGSASAATWTVPLSGSAQTASKIPGDPDGTGTATITTSTSGLAGARVCATVSWSNIAQPVVAAHIHQGAYGYPENPAWTINLFGPNVGGTPSGATYCNTAVTSAQLAAMDTNPWLFNVTVHNQAYPAGAIRGQLYGGTPLCEKIDESLCVGS